MIIIYKSRKPLQGNDCLKKLKDMHLHILVHIQFFLSSEFVITTRIQKRHAYLGVNT